MDRDYRDISESTAQCSIPQDGTCHPDFDEEGEITRWRMCARCNEIYTELHNIALPCKYHPGQPIEFHNYSNFFVYDCCCAVKFSHDREPTGCTRCAHARTHGEDPANALTVIPEAIAAKCSTSRRHVGVVLGVEVERVCVPAPTFFAPDRTLRFVDCENALARGTLRYIQTWEGEIDNDGPTDGDFGAVIDTGERRPNTTRRLYTCVDSLVPLTLLRTNVNILVAECGRDARPWLVLDNLVREGKNRCLAQLLGQALDSLKRPA